MFGYLVYHGDVQCAVDIVVSFDRYTWRLFA